MRTRSSATICALLVWSAPAFAHEGGDHSRVMGTVRSIDEHTIVVKTTKGNEKAVRLDDETDCSEDKRAGRCSAVKPGDRVVVTTRTKDGRLIAEEIRFSSGSRTGPGEYSKVLQDDGPPHSNGQENQ